MSRYYDRTAQLGRRSATPTQKEHRVANSSDNSFFPMRAWSPSNSGRNAARSPSPTRNRAISPLAMASSTTTGSVEDPPSRGASPEPRDANKNRFLEDIRHEVMVNYIFQQQCSQLWLDHEAYSGHEGVIMRKAKGTYLTCPPDLVESELANACIEMNIQVSMLELRKVITDCIRPP
jgi:hypothetical protein